MEGKQTVKSFVVSLVIAGITVNTVVAVAMFVLRIVDRAAHAMRYKCFGDVGLNVREQNI
jgi:ABC-type Fe3+ transport system permease subunit